MGTSDSEIMYSTFCQIAFEKRWMSKAINQMG